MKNQSFRCTEIKKLEYRNERGFNPRGSRGSVDGPIYPVTSEDISTIISPYSNPLKSMKGNDGMFDMKNPNIYKQKGGFNKHDGTFWGSYNLAKEDSVANIENLKRGVKAGDKKITYARSDAGEEYSRSGDNGYEFTWATAVIVNLFIIRNLREKKKKRY